MSRTYRRTRPGDLSHWSFNIDWKLERSEEFYFVYHWVKRDKSDPEYQKDLRRAQSDAGTHSCKEPGPRWFRNLFTERPARRKAKRELQKYIERNGEYEVMILPKEPLEYWT